MTIDEAISKTVQEFEKAIQHMKEQFTKLQVGRANASLVEDIMVDMYGSQQPIKAVAGVSVPDPRTIQIQPWDKGALAPIEKAIISADLGLNPVNDGMLVRISIPSLTEERRAELTKHVHKLAEEARISIRNSRQDAHNIFKQLKADGDITEDDLRGSDKKSLEKVDLINKQVDEEASAKEKDVMTV